MADSSSDIPSYDQWHADFNDWIDSVDEAVESLQNDFQEKFVEIDVDTRLSYLTEQTEAIHAQLEDLAVQFADQKQDIFLQLDNASIQRRNGLVCRFHDNVFPLKTPTHQQQKIQPLKWYWRLHDNGRAEQLIEQHKFYQIPLADWVPGASGNSEDSDSEDNDSTDLNHSVPPPSTLQEAVRLYRDQAVQVLFGRLGLHYQKIEELEQRRKLLRKPVLVKRRNDTVQVGSNKRDYHSKLVSTESDMGTMTQAFTSPTQSSPS